MKTKIGLWIDHRKAIIVAISDKDEKLKVIESNVEKQFRRISDAPMKGHHEGRAVHPEDTQERSYIGHLDIYYKEIIAYIRNAESILIFGPGEAKNELKKHLEQSNLGEHIKSVETADKMTDNQIVAKVKHYFLK